jgi:glycerol kinase
MQLCADSAGVEMRVSDLADCSPDGAILAGQLGPGVDRSREEIRAAPRPAETVYRPSILQEDVATLRTGWKLRGRMIS